MHPICTQFSVFCKEGMKPLGRGADSTSLPALRDPLALHTQRSKIFGVNEMAKKILENEEAKETIAKAIAGGESQTAIAQTLGVSQSTISRLAKREDVKALIDAESLNLLGVLPDAVENVKELVREMKNIPEKETKRRELSYKASHDVLKAAGLMPTPVQSQVIQNIYNDNRIHVHPVIEALLKQHGDTFDADFDEDEAI
ncbi:MAG: helix-turn-helix domain-containing protein [Proteobacteria bacterium]|nr:helix-turn-helix domain-containing protein [Pseudomonadota bacterium]